MKSRATQAATPDTGPLLTRQPWLIVGISRSAFYRLLAADQAPRPLAVPGSGRVWRVSDLERWVGTMKPVARSRSRRGRAARPAPEQGQEGTTSSSEEG